MANDRRRLRSSFTEQTSPSPLATELPYWDFTDGVCVLADGSYAAALRLSGKSIEAWDDDSINRLTLDLRSFLNGLPDDQELSLVAETSGDVLPLIQNHAACAAQNPDIIALSAARLASLSGRAARGELRRRQITATIYRRSSSSKGNGIVDSFKAFFEKRETFVTKSRLEHDQAQSELKRSVTGLVEALSSVSIGCRPLGHEDLAKWAWSFLNPRGFAREAFALDSTCRTQEFARDELNVVKELALPTPREQLLESDLLLGRDGFILDGLHHRVLSLRSLPEATSAGMMARLCSLPIDHVLHLHIKVPRQSEELARLHTRRRMAHSMSMSHGGRAVDLESEAKLTSAEDMLRDVINAGQKIFLFQLTVLVRNESAENADAMAKQVLAKFREINGADGLVESVGAFRVWKTMLPAGNTAMVRGRRVKTDNLADFLPVFQPFEGAESAKPVCLFENTAGGLVKYDPFSPALPNFNGLVTGSSGSGKSFLNNLVLLQAMAERPQVFIIDIGGSYRKLSEYLNGQYVEISPPEAGEAVQTINPFALGHRESRPSPRKLKFLMSLSELMLSDEDAGRIGRLERSALEECLLKIYSFGSAERTPTLSSLVHQLKVSESSALQDFAKMLFPWTGDRPYGLLLDQQSTLNLASDVVVFDLKGLSSFPDLQAVMILIITDFILCRVESTEAVSIGRKKMILLDEAWELLKSRPAAAFMEYCVRTLRKMGAGITFITQGLEEVMASPIGGAILSNTATKFVLRQRGDLEPVRKILKLNDQELALIASLRQSKGNYSEAFMICGDDRAVVRARPSPLEYWLATSDANDNRLLAEAREQAPDAELSALLASLAKSNPCEWKGRG